MVMSLDEKQSDGTGVHEYEIAKFYVHMFSTIHSVRQLISVGTVGIRFLWMCVRKCVEYHNKIEFREEYVPVVFFTKFYFIRFFMKISW